MVYVQWPSSIASEVNVWRLLDLGGMTRSVRESRNVTRGGYVYCNGSQVSLKSLAPVGSPLTIEIRVPHRPVISQQIFVRNRLTRHKPRHVTRSINRRG